MSALLCTGCNRTFAHPGYRLSHLRQTRNPACLAVGQALLAPDADSDPSPPPSPPQSTPPTSGHSPQPTAPATANHGQTTLSSLISSRDEIVLHDEIASNTRDDTSDISDTSDSFEDSDASDDPDGPPDASDNLGDGVGMNDNDEEHGRFLTRSEAARLQGESWVEPTVAHYPGKRAGEVCAKGITVMQEYENALGGPSGNPHSPFSSQINWELAKWGKLRGPSATSFTELLNIGGVSLASRFFTASSHRLHPAARTTESVLYKFE